MSFDAHLAKQTMHHVEKFLENHHIDCDDHHLILKRSFNEAWFSNMLAWLFDPKGSHGLGIEFLQEFLKLIAKKRSQEDGYERRKSFLKWGKVGIGRTTSGLSLGNASVAREFFLAGAIEEGDSQGKRFCDMVLLDLDPADGLFVVIENKLFTTNHPQQLDSYHKTIEERYLKRTKIREYVYLTFHGFSPKKHKGDSQEMAKIWLRCSWTEDIAGILDEFPKSKQHGELKQLVIILRWLKGIYTDRKESKANDFREKILYAAAYCLEEELNRLGEKRQGKWSIAKEGITVKLVHSSNPKSPLTIEMLPNLSVAVQGHRQGHASFAKIIIPYGVNTDQIFNLLDIAARDIYYVHFGDQAAHYLNTHKRPVPKHDCTLKNEVKPLFDFVAAHFEALRVLFTVSHHVWDQEAIVE